MSKRLDNFFTSGWSFNNSEMELKSRFQMMNIAIVLSFSALSFGLVGNIIRGLHVLIPLEIVLLCVNVKELFQEG